MGFQIRNLRAGILGGVPEEVREHVKLLLNTEPTVRPDADQLSKVTSDSQCLTPRTNLLSK